MYYIIFDLEATCWKNDKTDTSEIIEIGAVKLNDKLEVVSEFSSFVRPKLHPILSTFCKELTTIRQEDVDRAKTFPQVWKEFWDWAVTNDGEVDMRNVTFCSWGHYDKKQIMSDLSLHRIREVYGRLFGDSHISIKHEFSEVRNLRPMGMPAAMKLLGIPQEGTHHRGIDDARNIAKIFVKIFPELGLPQLSK